MNTAQVAEQYRQLVREAEEKIAESGYTVEELDQLTDRILNLPTVAAVTEVIAHEYSVDEQWKLAEAMQWACTFHWAGLMEMRLQKAHPIH